MKLNITRTVLGVAAGLIALAMPGYSSTLTFDDSNTPSGGTVSVTGSTVNSITNAVINQLAFTTTSTTDYVVTSGTLSTCTGTLPTGCGSTNADELVINGSVTIGTHTLNETLATIILSSAMTASQTGSLFGITIGNISSITYGANLLSDLGIVSGSPTGFSGFVNGTESGTGSNLIPDSNQIQATVTATPEPASWLLMGTGLLGLALFARRKSAQQVS